MEKVRGAISREKFGFVKLEKTVSVLFASRMTQEIFVGHHDRTGAVLCITKNGIVVPATNWEGLCGTPWQMVAPELKLTKKVTADKEGAGPPLPRIVVGKSARS